MSAVVLACENTGVEQAPALSRDPVRPSLSSVVTVRYWAAAKAAAGRPEDTVSAETVADVIAAVRRLHADNGRFLQVLAISSLLIGASPLGNRDPAEVRIGADDVVEVLPPFAGG